MLDLRFTLDHIRAGVYSSLTHQHGEEFVVKLVRKVSAEGVSFEDNNAIYLLSFDDERAFHEYRVLDDRSFTWRFADDVHLGTVRVQRTDTAFR